MTVAYGPSSFPGGGFYPSLTADDPQSVDLLVDTVPNEPIALGARTGYTRLWIWLADYSGLVQCCFSPTPSAVDRPPTAAWPALWTPGAWTQGENTGAFGLWIGPGYQYLWLLSATEQKIRYQSEVAGGSLFLIDDVTGAFLFDTETEVLLINA